MPAKYKKRMLPYKKRSQNRRRMVKKKKFVYKRPSYNTVIQKQLITSDRMFTKLKYMEVDSERTRLSIAPGANYTITAYIANQIVNHAGEPSTGSVIHVPGFVQWASMYARYRVHAVKVKVMMTSDDANTQGETSRPLLGFIHLQSDPSPGNFTTWNQVRQLDGNRYSTFKPLAITQAGGQVIPTYLTKYYNLAQVNGNKEQYRVDDAYEGLTGQPNSVNPVGPQRVFSYYVGLMTMDGSLVSTNTQNVAVYLTTTFYVEFKDRYDLAGPQA